MMRAFQNDGSMATPIEIIVNSRQIATLKISHNNTILDYASTETDYFHRLKVWNDKVKMYNMKEFKLNWDSVIVIKKDI
jgi:sporulation protein YlmC with PRC-barrel domain